MNALPYQRLCELRLFCMWAAQDVRKWQELVGHRIVHRFEGEAEVLRAEKLDHGNIVLVMVFSGSAIERRFDSLSMWLFFETVRYEPVSTLPEFISARELLITKLPEQIQAEEESAIRAQLNRKIDWVHKTAENQRAEAKRQSERRAQLKREREIEEEHQRSLEDERMEAEYQRMAEAAASELASERLFDLVSNRYDWMAPNKAKVIVNSFNQVDVLRLIHYFETESQSPDGKSDSVADAFSNFDTYLLTQNTWKLARASSIARREGYASLAIEMTNRLDQSSSILETDQLKGFSAVLTSKAAALHETQDLEAALDCARRAYLADMKNWMALTTAGSILLRKREITKAAWCFNKANDLSDGKSEAELHRHFDTIQNESSRQELVKKLVELNPKRYQYLEKLLG